MRPKRNGTPQKLPAVVHSVSIHPTRLGTARKSVVSINGTDSSNRLSFHLIAIVLTLSSAEEAETSFRLEPCMTLQVLLPRPRGLWLRLARTKQSRAVCSIRRPFILEVEPVNPENQAHTWYGGSYLSCEAWHDRK